MELKKKKQKRKSWRPEGSSYHPLDRFFVEKHIVTELHATSSRPSLNFYLRFEKFQNTSRLLQGIGSVRWTVRKTPRMCYRFFSFFCSIDHGETNFEFEHFYNGNEVLLGKTNDWDEVTYCVYVCFVCIVLWLGRITAQEICCARAFLRLAVKYVNVRARNVNHDI